MDLVERGYLGEVINFKQGWTSDRTSKARYCAAAASSTTWPAPSPAENLRQHSRLREALCRSKVMADFGRGTQTRRDPQTPRPIPLVLRQHRPEGRGCNARRSRAVVEHRRIVAARGRRSDHGILGAGDAASRVVIWDADVRY